MIPPVQWKTGQGAAPKKLPAARRAPKGAQPKFGGYYVMKSLLAPGIYKLGVTTSLERRLGEHGGRAKHEVVAWLPMQMDAARALERQIRTRFHSCLITNGNEIFALTDEQLEELLALL